ncbi:hypothetical protein X975_14001, partial [Stegodyphus mimosarum]
MWASSNSVFSNSFYALYHQSIFISAKHRKRHQEVYR